MISFETFNNYHPMEDIASFLDFSFYHVTYNTADKSKEKKRLETVPCSEVTFEG